VLAFPYDVCAWMPEVVIHLGNYVHEVPQIAVSAFENKLFERFFFVSFQLKKVKLRFLQGFFMIRLAISIFNRTPTSRRAWGS